MENSILVSSPKLIHSDEKRVILDLPFITNKGNKKSYTLIDNTNYVTSTCVSRSFPKNPPINQSKYKVDKLPRGYRAGKQFPLRGYVSTERQQEEAKLALLAEIEMMKRKLQ